jgi:hypothetical protein
MKKKMEGERKMEDGRWKIGTPIYYLLSSIFYLP